MRKFSGATLGIEQGDEEVFSDFEDGGEMWTGSGTRERRKAVVFAEPFKSRPVVQVGVSLWDMDQSANLRADIGADKVTEWGFELVFRTWADSRVARARMNWMAIGEVKSEDDWDLR
ncbi:H-type lectin domain-containing protein [Sagittula salina]|uniref:H-type lectin domain-containing protein n=1 Tax=Sagittula salina TaxID=2820268 RepID=A0A940MN74_9RHOB|nr:H-type lectin domain-containing protein [Sagittula salina]MBP0482653.1 H-type lectin domain-containing protein [Sagittula salina]